MINKTAVVLMSGGMDSALCAAIAINDGYEIAALHTNYGQRTETKELLAFISLCDYYKIEKKLIVNIDYLRQIGGSSLTDSAIEVGKADLDSTDIPQTYVPFRNANLLGIATAWAETIGAEAIYIGAVESDSSGYPDCRESFYKAYQSAINEGTKPETKIIIKTPIITFKKSDIVKKGLEFAVPFHLTWSCYKSEEKACGECDSCALRLRGFKEANSIDPILYYGGCE